MNDDNMYLPNPSQDTSNLTAIAYTSMFSRINIVTIDVETANPSNHRLICIVVLVEQSTSQYMIASIMAITVNGQRHVHVHTKK